MGIEKLQMKYTTELIEWLMINHLDHKTNIIGTRVKFPLHVLHECDMIVLSSSNYATEIEIKTVYSDLKNDMYKIHSHENKLLKYFYYAVPEYLEQKAIDIVPSNAGIYIVRYRQQYENYYVDCIRQAKVSDNYIKWSNELRDKLLLTSTRSIERHLRYVVKLQNQNNLYGNMIAKAEEHKNYSDEVIDIIKKYQSFEEKISRLLDEQPNLYPASKKARRDLKIYCAKHGLTFTEAIERLLKENQDAK